MGSLNVSGTLENLGAVQLATSSTVRESAVVHWHQRRYDQANHSSLIH